MISASGLANSMELPLCPPKTFLLSPPVSAFQMTPPPPPQSERIERLLSDMGDESENPPLTSAFQLNPPVMSFQSTPPPPPHSERSEVSEADERNESEMEPPSKNTFLLVKNKATIHFNMNQSLNHV